MAVLFAYEALNLSFLDIVALLKLKGEECFDKYMGINFDIIGLLSSNNSFITQKINIIALING
jgi:hypothetical protein